MPGVELLERAVAYTRGSLALVTDDGLDAPTPCAGWDLRRLLEHMTDSLASLSEAAGTGRVAMVAASGDRRTVPTAGALVGSLRTMACDLLAGWSVVEQRPTSSDVLVGGWPLAPHLLVAAGALEVAVHGWDVAVACGTPRPMPPALAADLLRVSTALVTEADRPHRFAPPLAVPAAAAPEQRLLAWVGRQPVS